MNPRLKLVRTSSRIILAIMLTAAVAAVAQVETIDAQARGTSTQSGRQIGIKIIINQYSPPEDRQKLIDAFKKGGNDEMARTLFKMKGVGRIQIPGTVGYTIAFARSIPTPTGRKIRFVTDRKIAFFEAAQNTRSQSYNLTAGEVEINDQDKGKSTGVLYPAAQLGISNEGQLQFSLYQNPWQLVGIIDWTPKNKEQ